MKKKNIRDRYVIFIQLSSKVQTFLYIVFNRYTSILGQGYF